MMRLKSLTPTVTLLMLAVCLVLGATLWWSKRALERPQHLMAQYLALSEYLQRLANEIGVYLDGGDALRHRAVQDTLQQFEDQLSGLPAALSDRLRPSLIGLRQFAEGDLLAAGKLAADPLGLLIQAEREMSVLLNQLADYALLGDPQHALAYPPRLLDAALHLQRLGLARGQPPLLQSDISQALAALGQAITAVEALPLLGVHDTAVSVEDHFAALLGLQSAATDTAQDDRGMVLKRQLASLAQRYPAELERTRALIQQRLQLRERSDTYIAALQEALAELGPLVRNKQQRIQAEVTTLQLLAILLILCTALLTYALQRHLTRMLAQMDSALGAWARGDFTRPVRLASPLNEVQRIGLSLNHLRDYVTGLVATLRRHANQVAESSRNLTELSQALRGSATQQAQQEAEVHGALGILEQSIQQVASDAGQAAEANRQAGDATRESQQAIERSLDELHGLVQAVRGNADGIRQLTEESVAIEQVLDVIGGLAEQTNLLALNAAIEAARAGPSGRGFAVVADEVRALAQRSTEATEQIRIRIGQLQQTAEQARRAKHSQVTQAEQSAAQAERADGAITDGSGWRASAQMALRIAAATAEQSAGVGHIHRHSADLHQRGQANLQRIAGTHVQSEALLALSQQLQAAAEAFRVD